MVRNYKLQKSRHNVLCAKCDHLQSTSIVFPGVVVCSECGNRFVEVK